VTTTGGGGGSAAKSYTVVGVSSYQQLKGSFTSFTVLPNIAALTINGYANLTVLKGTVITLTSAPFSGTGSQFNMNIYSDISTNSGDVYNSQVNRKVIEPSYVGVELVDFLTTVLYPDLIEYTTGITGSNTPTVVWDTKVAAAGLYYLGTPSGYRDFNGGIQSFLTIFIMSPTPVLLTYPNTYTAFLPVLAAKGDFVKIYPQGGDIGVAVFCMPKGSTTAQATLLAKSPSYAIQFVTIDTSSIDTSTTYCYMSSDGLGAAGKGVLFIYPREVMQSTPGVSTRT
jgi:hypothetical protein